MLRFFDPMPRIEPPEAEAILLPTISWLSFFNTVLSLRAHSPSDGQKGAGQLKAGCAWDAARHANYPSTVFQRGIQNMRILTRMHAKYQKQQQNQVGSGCRRLPCSGNGAGLCRNANRMKGTFSTPFSLPGHVAHALQLAFLL